MITRRTGLALIPALLLLGPAFAPAGAEEKPMPRRAAAEDLKKFQGRWDCVAMEREGNEVPAENLKGTFAVYEGDHVTLYRDGEVYRRAAVTLNPEHKPRAAINTWDLNGPYADSTLAGIYEIDGDTLKLCFAQSGEARPTEFTTKSGTGFLFGTYKRKKP